MQMACACLFCTSETFSHTFLLEYILRAHWIKTTRKKNIWVYDFLATKCNYHTMWKTKFFLFLYLPETVKQINLVQILKSCLFKIHFNIALVSIPTLSKCSLSFRSSTPNPVYISLSSQACKPNLSHPPLFYRPNFWRKVQIVDIL